VHNITGSSGFINGVATKKIYGCFTGTIKSGRNKEVTILTGRVPL